MEAFTSSSASVLPDGTDDLKEPSPSPNVMVPKQRVRDLKSGVTECFVVHYVFLHLPSMPTNTMSIRAPIYLSESTSRIDSRKLGGRWRTSQYLAERIVS